MFAVLIHFTRGFIPVWALKRMIFLNEKPFVDIKCLHPLNNLGMKLFKSEVKYRQTNKQNPFVYHNANIFLHVYYSFLIHSPSASLKNYSKQDTHFYKFFPHICLTKIIHSSVAFYCYFMVLYDEIMFNSKSSTCSEWCSQLKQTLN